MVDGAIVTRAGEKGLQLAAAARRFLGTPFLLHGRDPRFGLDCIGLVHVSLTAMGCEAISPEGYGLKNSAPHRWYTFADLSGLIDAHGPPKAGDVILLKMGPGQYHLAISVNGRSVIHAHAGLRRVVQQDIAMSGRVVRHWRIAERTGD